MSEARQPAGQDRAAWEQERRCRPVIPVVAVFSRHWDAIDWARQKLEAALGPVALASEPFPFHHTRYYEPMMGAELRKQLFAFAGLRPEDSLADLKLLAISLEKELAGEGRFPEIRPVNIDPGILNFGKFLLATTKDQAHRIYLRDGIYAEVTLQFREGAFHAWPWTYADYREPALHEFLLRVRAYYARQLASRDSPVPDRSR